jgi:hypothetical protein
MNDTCMLRSDRYERVAVSISRTTPSAPTDPYRSMPSAPTERERERERDRERERERERETDPYRTVRSRLVHGRPSPPNV